MSRWQKSAHGGVPGEMLRRMIREADPATWEAAEAEKAKLRADALALITPFPQTADRIVG
jgi:hypothetical protein